MINRSDYLESPDVGEFVAYLAGLLKGEIPFFHQFTMRTRVLPMGYRDRYVKDGVLSIDGLEQAFERYAWNGRNFYENEKDLDCIRRLVRRAIENERKPGGAEQCVESILKVLEWGAGGKGQRLYTSNAKWVLENQAIIIQRLADGRHEMASDMPDLSVFHRKNGSRFNAGFAKYYALACDDSVIYDGRVGAALGLLVREYCNSRKLNAVPGNLLFRWGAQNPGARSPETALPRNPSVAPYAFPQLPPQGGPAWAQCNILANWVLKAAQVRASQAVWCQGADGLRRIEAALFTIGYAMPMALAS